MAELSLAGIPPDLEEPGRYAAAALHALAREEAAGRKPRRLLEPDQADWMRFRGRMGPVNFLELLLEDASVSQPFAFDINEVMGSRRGSVGRLPPGRVGDWLEHVADLELGQDSSDYIADQARRLGLPTRFAPEVVETLSPRERQAMTVLVQNDSANTAELATVFGISTSRVNGLMNGPQMKLREAGCARIAGSRLPSGQTQYQVYDS